jgi:hypothetical protein
MSEQAKWSYLAGFFDGEGCIHIADFQYPYSKPDRIQQVYRLDIHITQTDVRAAKWLVKNFGGVYYTRESSGNWSAAYRWVPKGKKNKEAMLLGMLPYLIIKRDQALVALEFLRMNGKNDPAKRAELARQCRDFKTRGKSVETNTLEASIEAKIESDLMGDHECASQVIANA